MQDTVIFRKTTMEEIPALVRLRLATRIETYSEIYPREWIDGFDVAASEERFRGIANDPDQHLCFIEVDGACAGYLCFGREMEKTMIDMPPEMQMIGERIKSATTLEELEMIKSELDHKINDFRVKYNDLLISVGIDPSTI